MPNHRHTDRGAVHHTAWIALGANLGDRARTLQSAISALDTQLRTRVVAVSSFHETQAVTPIGADAEPQPEYLNAAASLKTDLSPGDLLNAMQRIEIEHGRVRSSSARWAPRTLDLDLLLYDQRVIDEPGLCVPHPRMAERLFVLAPMVEIAPDVVHPPTGRTIADLFEALARATNPSP